MRPRRPMGYASAMSEPCTGNVFALAMPAPNRVQNSMNALTARPDSMTMPLKMRLAIPMMRDRE